MIAALTEKRLIIRRLIGKPFDIPVSEFASVREDKWFLSSYRSGRLYVIIKLKDGIELCVIARDASWLTGAGTKRLNSLDPTRFTDRQFDQLIKGLADQESWSKGRPPSIGP